MRLGVLLCLLAAGAAPAAEAPPAGYQDATDLFKLLGLGKKEQGRAQPFTLYPAVLPAFGYNPSLGFVLGGVATLGMYLGDIDTTTISSLQTNILFTSKKQFVVQVSSTVLTEGNEWQFQGDWRFLIYNQATYGLGTGTPPVSYGFTIGGLGTTAALGGQVIDFNLIRIKETPLKRMWRTLYAGLGYSYERYYGIVDNSLDLAASPPAVTSHYTYSKAYGFPTSAYAASGPVLSVLWDSRDSTINPYKGVYANVTMQFNLEGLGSTRDSTVFGAELRTYLPLSDDLPRNVIAFWMITQGVIAGDVPYLNLPSISWDARNRSGRGYVQGQFRGTAEVYLEGEWRFRLTESGLLGGAVFASAQSFARPALTVGSTTDPGESLLQNIAPAAGIGLRIMMNRISRTNVTLDYAWGSKTSGLYFGAGEAF